MLIDIREEGRQGGKHQCEGEALIGDGLPLVCAQTRDQTQQPWHVP